MAQYFKIHPKTPQRRLIKLAVEIVRTGGLIVYPTDSSYALACHLGDKHALDRIRRIRQLDDKHNFTLVCQDMSQIAAFAKVGNDGYRLIKSLTPGPYTFVIKATREVPRRLQHPKRKTIGIRIPNHPVAKLLLRELDEPLFTSTLILPGEKQSIVDPHDIRERLDSLVDLIIDAGPVRYSPTTIISLTEKAPEVIRRGEGEIAGLIGV